MRLAFHLLILLAFLAFGLPAHAEFGARVPDFDRDALQILPRGRTGARLDLNNDGFKDIVYISENGNIRQIADLDIYKPDFLIQPGVPLLLVERASPSIAAADMDGDGDEDIVFAGADPSGERFALRWLINDGRPNPDFSVRVLFDIGLPIEFAVADFDKSGTMDVLTQAEGRFDLLLNEGFTQGDSAPDFRRLFQRNIPRPSRILGTGDFNGDSWLDVFLVTGAGQLEIAYYLPNSDPPTLTIKTPAPLLTEFPLPTLPRSWATADFNGDGHLDLLVSVPEVGAFWIENDGGDPPAYTLNEIPILAAGDPESCATGDIDGDGQPDTLFVFPSGQLLCLLNNNGGATWTQCEAEDPDERFGGEDLFVMLEDLDGDGRDEPIAFSDFFARYFQETPGYVAGFITDRIYAGDDLRDFNNDDIVDVADGIALFLEN